MPFANEINLKNNNVEDESNNILVKPRKSRIGYFFGVLAAMFTALGTFFLKISDENTLKVVLLRFAFQFIVLLPYMSLKKIDLFIFNWKIFVLISLRGVLGPLIMVLLGFSMNSLALGDAMAIFYIYPVQVVLFACICLKEKCGLLNVFLTLVTMGGFILVAQPSFIFGGSQLQGTHTDASRLTGVLFALLASSSAALVTIVIRKLGPHVHFTQQMMIVGIEGALFASVVLVIEGKIPTPCFSSLAPIFGCTVSFFSAQICRTIALQREKAGPITLIQTSQVVFSFLLQFLFLGVVPNLLCVVGSCLILFSCLVLGIKNILRTTNIKKKF